MKKCSLCILLTVLLYGASFGSYPAGSGSRAADEEGRRDLEELIAEMYSGANYDRHSLRKRLLALASPIRASNRSCSSTDSVVI